MGINLFPGKKICPFNCPYCEVFPFSTNAIVIQEQMECDLRSAIANALKQNIPVKDICFSGNGEPSLSPDFPEALNMAAHIRDEMIPSAKLVLITNGAGLPEPGLFSLLHDAAISSLLNIWLKLDAGTAAWYRKINRTDIPFEKIIAAIKKFAACTPVTIQTMLCTIDGESPPPEEAYTWEQLMLELSAAGNIRAVQIYGKARPAPEDPKSSSLPVAYLEERAASLRQALKQAPFVPQVEVYP